MSEPNETKAQVKANRDEKRRQEERSAHRSARLYTIVGGIVVVAAILMMVWNSGIFQRSLTAVEINGSKYTAADVDFYFTSTYNNLVNSYMSQMGLPPFDIGTSTKKQVMDPESGKTWYDEIMEQAMEQLKADTALAAKATQEGYTLSQEAQESLDTALAQLDSGWIGTSYPSRNAFIRGVYGPFMTYDRVVELMKLQVLAYDYAQTQLDAIVHTDEDYETYYTENADDLDTYTLTQFLFQAKVNTTDEDGNSIEMTEEEKTAALEKAKSEQKALAEELKGKLEAGENPQTLADEYADQLYSSTLSRTITGAELSASGLPYGDWAMESGRQSGDVNLSELDTGTACNYYVVIFESRARDNTPTADVRHILIAAEQDEGAAQPTQEQYDAAYTKAEELLEQWKSGEATEDSFSALAKENSADPGSAQNGGLIPNVSTSSPYVDTFTSWALDPSRQSGDTGIVQNTGSSTKGWHIMYYVSSGDPIWKQVVAQQLRLQDSDQLISDVSEGMSVTQSTGMKLVSGK